MFLLRPPLFEKVGQSLSCKPAGIFDFAIFRTENHSPIALGNANGWNSFVEGNPKLLRKVFVLVTIRPDVDMDNFIVGIDECRNVRSMKCQVEHMAVKAPVCAKDQ